MMIELLLAVPLGLSCARAAEKPAAEAAEIKALIGSAVNATIEVLKDKKNDREARRKKIFALIDPVVDFSLMGKLTLGRAHWGALDENQKNEFVESFSRAVRDSVFEKIEIYTNETAEFETPTPAEGGKYQMLMFVLSKGQRYKALYKVYRQSSVWKVYDLEIEGISMVRTYAAQYDQVMRKGGAKDLLAKLKAKALATPEEIKNAGKK